MQESNKDHIDDAFESTPLKGKDQLNFSISEEETSNLESTMPVNKLKKGQKNLLNFSRM